MSRSLEKRWPKDRWDAVAAGAVSADHFKHYDKAAAASCLDQQHVVVLGESTTRDLFSRLAHAGLKPTSGACMNTGGHEKAVYARARGADAAYQRDAPNLANSSRARTRRARLASWSKLLSDRPPTHVFVYCFMYDW